MTFAPQVQYKPDRVIVGSAAGGGGLAQDGSIHACTEDQGFLLENRNES